LLRYPAENRGTMGAVVVTSDRDVLKEYLQSHLGLRSAVEGRLAFTS